MGKIKELRAKVAEGTATDEEKEELDTLEEEAKDPVDGDGADSGDGVDAGDGTGTDSDDAEGDKLLDKMGRKLAKIAMGHLENDLKKDAKKGGLGGDSDDKSDPKPTGKELVKQFFIALFENNRTKLDHLSSTNADGGYLVPAEFANDFIIARQNATVMRRAGATVVSITSNTFNLPNLATRPRAYWATELAVKSSTSASWGNISLTPYTLAAIMTASNQVIADAKIGGNLLDVITQLMTEAIAFAEDTAFFTGSGSGQPTGLVTYTPPRTVDCLGVLTADKLIQAVYALRQPYRSRAKWFMNSRTLAVVRQLKDSQNRYIFENAIAGVDFPTILGAPVYEMDDMASNIIWFGDPAGYWIADREGVSVAVSDVATVSGQSAFERNFTAVRIEERVDGELGDTAAFTRLTNVPVS